MSRLCCSASSGVRPAVACAVFSFGPRVPDLFFEANAPFLKAPEGENAGGEGGMDRSRLSSGGVRGCLQAILVLVFASTASFISGVALGSEILWPAGRNLLQASKNCPVDFEFLNYTIITSQCKGPRYPPKLCCGALLEFACPYYEQVNDVTNDCASTMFSYINLYGKYPPGLFASECTESHRGLECNSVLTSAENTASAATVATGIPTVGALMMGALLHFLLL